MGGPAEREPWYYRSVYRNWANFRRFIRRSLFAPREAPYRLTLKRAVALLSFCGLYTVTEIAASLGFLLDDVFAPAYRQTRVDAPVFIIGNPRSGTTLLHRLLAQDTETFTTMRLLDILFAPSVTQQRFARGLARLDAALGGPIRRTIGHLDAAAARGNVLHSARLLAPEEDQFLMVHPWAGLAVWHFSGVLEEASPYTRFDTAVPPGDKTSIMGFYASAVRRHLHAHQLGGGHTHHYLAKNPAASPMVASLCEVFPDARFIYLVRNPLQMIPSMISTLDLTWQLLGSPPRRYAGRDYVLEMAKHWYTYPLERLAELPSDRRFIVTFDELTRHADTTVTRIYERFGLRLSAAFERTLAHEAAAARTYRSSHRYDLDAMGLTRDQIQRDFAAVFERFGFSTGED